MMRNANRLPPVEHMICEAEARIDKCDQRLLRVELAVTAVLTERSAESLDALKELLAEVKADDPYEAVLPQLENLGLAVLNIDDLHDTAEKAVAESNATLTRKLDQHRYLQVILKNLQDTLRSGNGSQIRGFIKDLTECGASYAAHQ